ncbi:MAG: hypothetical protein IPN69_08380 [Acidobacteria bacterium]|nr:hypothetical protein [Acidobacteriota bacterium]
MKIIVYVLSGIVSTAFLLLTWSVSRENTDIKHRLDVRDAYFNKGLIDAAKARETALIETERFATRLLEHCKAQRSGCNLPNELTVLPPKPQLTALDQLLTQQSKEK